MLIQVKKSVTETSKGERNMLKSIEATGINRDDAIENALKELNLDRDSVSVEVLDNGKKGFLGFGSTKARVKVTYEVPDEKPVVKKPEPPKPQKKQEEPKVEKVQKPVKTQPKVEKPKVEQIKKEVPKKEPVQKPQSKPKEKVEVEHVKGVELPQDQITESAKNAVVFIDGLLEKLGISGKAIVLDTTNSSTVNIEIVGDDMGAVIGRRGDTLDAIQYLTSLVANREKNDHTRITIDTENYRAKREESLQRLAHKMAGKVLKYKKNMTLEPMNPYERRIIHATLQDVKGITTYSTGTEPGRRIVIALEGRASNSQRNRNNG